MKRTWMPALLLAMALAPAAPTVAAPLNLKQGYKERWAFAMAGKPVGTMNAECTAVRGADKRGELDFKYDLKLELPAQGTVVRLAMTGTFTVTSSGTPVALTINADVAGGRQNVKAKFASGKATLSGTANGQAIQKDAAISGKELLSVNNLMTLFSLATQVLRPEPGKTVTAPFFAVELMRKLDITFAARPKTETIQVAGKRVECVVCDVSPISARIHVDKATGEMLRYTMDAQQLVISRQ